MERSTWTALERSSSRYNGCMTTAPRRPTILDVARAAGVSKSLVSIAIRGEQGVSERTRAHVLEVAGRLGYRSNAWARNLAGGRSGLLGVLLNDLGSGYHTDVVLGIEEAADREGLMVVIANGGRDAHRLGSRLDGLVELGVDGIVVVSGQTPREQLTSAARRVPLVVVGRLSVEGTQAGQVANDDREGARLAVLHLASLGHRRIAHLTASDRPAAADRRAAHLETLERLGLASAGVFEDDANGIDALLAAAREPDGPTAVFTSTDRLAARLLGRAVDAGLRIPQDLSIVGYDNTDLAASVRPALTSIDQHRQQLGARAVAQLLERLRGEAAPSREVLTPTLIVRASTTTATARGDRAAGA